MNYYITHHIDIEALHQDRLLELLNSYRLEILTKYKQLTDVYYSIEDGVLFQHCTTVKNHKVSKPFDMIHLNDDRFEQLILADITYDLLDNWDIFRDDSLYAIEMLPDIVRVVCTALGTIEETYDPKLDGHLTVGYTDSTQIVTTLLLRAINYLTTAIQEKLQSRRRISHLLNIRKKVT